MGFSTPKKPFDLKEFMENSVKKRPIRKRGYVAKRLAEKRPDEPVQSEAGEDTSSTE